jgi:hypothetical protein
MAKRAEQSHPVHLTVLCNFPCPISLAAAVPSIEGGRALNVGRLLGKGEKRIVRENSLRLPKGVPVK